MNERTRDYIDSCLCLGFVPGFEHQRPWLLAQHCAAAFLPATEHRATQKVRECYRPIMKWHVHCLPFKQFHGAAIYFTLQNGKSHLSLNMKGSLISHLWILYVTQFANWKIKLLLYLIWSKNIWKMIGLHLTFYLRRYQSRERDPSISVSESTTRISQVIKVLLCFLARTLK